MKIVGIGAVLVICVLQIASADWYDLKETQNNLIREVNKELARFKEYKDDLTIDSFWHMNQLIFNSLDEALRSVPIGKVGRPGAQKEDIGQRDCAEALNKHMSASRVLVVDAIEPCISEYHDAVVPILKNLETLTHIAEELLRELEEADISCKSDSDKETCLDGKLVVLKKALLALRGKATEAQETTGMTGKVHVERATKCMNAPLSKSKKKISALAEMLKACAA